jgi:IS5 family transposase
MFNLANFIKNGFIAAVGKMADYQIILNAAGWYDKGVLSEADLKEIQTAIDEKNARIEAERAAEAENAEAEGTANSETEV